jgi:hypothetical protein
MYRDGFGIERPDLVGKALGPPAVLRGFRIGRMQRHAAGYYRNAAKPGVGPIGFEPGQEARALAHSIHSAKLAGASRGVRAGAHVGRNLPRYGGGAAVGVGATGAAGPTVQREIERRKR